ncbi:MAG: 30S ribosomal protein S17 [Thermoplasmata archaeon]|nr:MAG: 30S ribosomal protein S17 [Thermoplasmata archaeon]RLF52376.1 MAG: 30S ribosomal protein S17 [Thermoplasmata archaeon]
MAEKKGRDIGLNVPVPENACDDKNCPFHGTLSVRGQIITGEVVSDKMQKTVVVKREYLHYVPKYERYEKRTSRYMAHCPPCLGVKVGDKVKIAECRPLSKGVSFVVIQKIEGERK